jgi:hypothetical protein
MDLAFFGLVPLVGLLLTNNNPYETQEEEKTNNNPYETQEEEKSMSLRVSDSE